MATVTDIAPSPAPDDADRNIALLAYGLVFFAIFFAGVPALIAVAIAYGRRRMVGRRVASHHRFQIFIFWIAFALTSITALIALASVMALILNMLGGGDLLGSVVHVNRANWGEVQIADLRIGHTFFTLLAAAIVMGAMTSLWLLIASGYGFVRLASGRSIRQTARS